MSELLEMSEFIELCSAQEPVIALSIFSSIQEVFDYYECSVVEWVDNPKPLLHFTFDNERGLLQVKCLFKAFGSSEGIITKLLSYWLLPSKILPIYSQVMHSFTFNKQTSVYSFSTITLGVVPNDWPQVEMMLSLVLGELEIGLLSYYHAKRILDTKVLSLDQKNFMVHESIIRRLQKFPQLYDYDVFDLMQRFFLTYSPTFCSFRSSKHLLDVILSLYLCQSSVNHQMMAKGSDFGSDRFLAIKVMNHQVQSPLGYCTHQTIVVSFSLLDKKEVFEKDHFFRAIKSLIRGVEYVDDSFFSHRDKQSSIGMFAVEIKGENLWLTRKKRALLVQRLNEEIQNYIQMLVNPVFMPLNEEEVMKNIVQLSHEIKSQDDIPQMILNFEMQAQGSLYFRAILARVVKKTKDSMTTQLMRSKKRIKVVMQREKIIPFEPDSYQKEIGVFRIELMSQPFLRQDFSVDVFRARESVCDFFKTVLGEIRDFNGAMLSFEISAYNDFSKSLKMQGFTQKNLMEQFYYAIFPAQKRLVVSSLILKSLFLLFYQEVLALRDQELFVSQNSDKKANFVVIKFKSQKKDATLLHKIKKETQAFDSLITFYLQVSNYIFVGAAFEEQKHSEAQAFIEQVKLSFY